MACWPILSFRFTLSSRLVRRFLARPNSPPVLAFLRSSPTPFPAGSWEKYPCTMARRSPASFFRRATIGEGRMFEGVKVSREIHPAAKFSLCFDDSLSTCIIDVGNLFCLFCFVYDSSLRYLFFGLIFLSGIREGKIVRGKK